MKIIDLSFNVEPNLSEPMSIKIKTRPHSGGSKFGRKIIFMGKRSLKDKAMAVIHYMSGKERITKKSFPDQEFINEQRISLSVHTGTHLDAPSHFGTRCEGKKTKTIDEIPLEWCYGNGVVLNFCNKGPCEEISVEDVKKELERIEYYIQENDIVLIRTDTDKKWGKPNYFYEAPGMSREATKFLVESGVKIIGIDCYSLDRPFMAMVKQYYRTNDKKCLWPAHFYGREKEYCHIERLTNLDKIPMNYGFKFCCFPIKLKEMGAAWVRAVAIIE